MLIGVNRHQHFAYVGDAMPNSLHVQDAIQLKARGFNIRLAHYPHDDAFLQACDELGMLVYEEGPSWIQLEDQPWRDKLEFVTAGRSATTATTPALPFGAGINHRGTIEQLHTACKEEDPTRPPARTTPWTGAQPRAWPTSSPRWTTTTTPSRTSSPLPTSTCHLDGGSTRNSSPRTAAREPLRHGGLDGLCVLTFHDPPIESRGLTRGGMMDIFRMPFPVMDWCQSELTTEPMIEFGEPGCQDTKLRVQQRGRGLGQRQADRRDAPDRDELFANLVSPPLLPVVYEDGEAEARVRRRGQPGRFGLGRTLGLPAAIRLWPMTKASWLLMAATS